MIFAFIATGILATTYYAQARWLWATLLMTLGTFLGIGTGSIIYALIGKPLFGILSFVGWPACAVWFHYAMGAMPKNWH